MMMGSGDGRASNHYGMCARVCVCVSAHMCTYMHVHM